MAAIYDTTMTPGKLELLAAWLPSRPWYTGAGRGPDLSKAGGFRLDDPEGEVGIEFMVVRDTSGDGAVSYHLPVTYRGAPLAGAEHALIGTSEHGVLGRRWVYDGTHDPVLVAQLLALFQGRAEPQHQSTSNTPEPSVAGHFTGAGSPALAAVTAVEHGRDGTDIVVETEPRGALTIGVTRVLTTEPHTVAPGAQGYVTAAWRSEDGKEHQAPFAVLYAAAP